jgi:hypothetical protein
MAAAAKDPVLSDLLRLVEDDATAGKLAPVLARLREALARAPESPQAWEPLTADLFGADAPPEIKSCWVFALRAGATFGSERHPNSHQRSIALRGAALFEVLDDGVWRQCPIDADAAPDGRCVSISPNTWHRIVIGPETLVSLSFHTVPAAELIEETPVGDDLAVTQRRLYSE